MFLERLLYTSRATQAFRPWDAQRIADVSAMLNRRRDITGVLAFTGRHFMQMLEGPSAGLDELLAALQHDARHDEFRLHRREPTRRRLSDAWSMRFVSALDEADALAAFHARPDPAAVERWQAWLAVGEDDPVTSPGAFRSSGYDTAPGSAPPAVDRRRH